MSVQSKGRLPLSSSSAFVVSPGSGGARPTEIRAGWLVEEAPRVVDPECRI